MPGRRRVKRDACWVVSRLIQDYRDMGGPFGACLDGEGGAGGEQHPRKNRDECDECDALAKALDEVQQEMERRGRK